MFACSLLWNVFIFKCIYFVILYAHILPSAHTWSVVGGTGESRPRTRARASGSDPPMRLWTRRKDIGRQWSRCFSWRSWSGRFNAPVRGSWFMKFNKWKKYKGYVLIINIEIWIFCPRGAGRSPAQRTFGMKTMFVELWTVAHLQEGSRDVPNSIFIDLLIIVTIRILLLYWKHHFYFSVGLR